MEKIVNIAFSQYNIDFLVVLWKLGCTNKNNCLCEFIQNNLKNLCKHYGFPEDLKFRHFVGRYDNWLFAQKQGTSKEKLQFFLEEGSIPLVRLALREQAKTITHTTDAALAKDQRLIKFYHKGNADHACMLCTTAAQHGHLQLLQWLKDNNCLWTRHSCGSMAVFGNQLKVLQWAYANGRGVNDACVCSQAFQAGHYDILEWAVEKGFPGADRYLPILEWRRKNKH